jgi:predicted RNA polymerase sigma factor
MSEPSVGEATGVEGARVGPAGVGEATIGRVFREESGRSVATLIRVVGQIEIAEDAVQDAFALALGVWPRDGLPPNPGGWITTTARRCAIDRLRRDARRRQLLHELAVLEHPYRPGAQEVAPVPDDRLRLIFTCCRQPWNWRLNGALSRKRPGSRTRVVFQHCGLPRTPPT